MKILAVDDEPIFLQLLQATLTDLGYTDLTRVTSGKEALDLIQSSPDSFDCFLLDIKMPGMNGIELCHAIRALPEFRRTPIMMNTVLNDRAAIDDAFAAGATDYLTKPINRAEIKARLGMVATLVAERKRRDSSVANGAATSEHHGRGYSFPFELLEVSGSVEFLALENYLLTLGKIRSLGIAATGIHVANGEEIFAMGGPDGFADTVIDIGDCIADTLKRSNYMLAYAGNSNFVYLTGRLSTPNMLDFSLELNAKIAEFETLYTELGIDLPQLVVGAPALGNLLSPPGPKQILGRAMKNAAREVEKHADLLAA